MRFLRGAAIGLVVVALSACSGSADETTTTAVETTSTTTVSTTTSSTTTTSTTSTTLAGASPLVDIEAPDSWTEVGPAEYELPAIAGGLAPTMVTVETGPLEDLDEAFTDAKTSRSEIMRDFEVLSEGERQVGRYDARFLEYAGVDQGNVARYEVWIQQDEALVHVTYSASVEAYTATKAEFEQTLVDSLG